MPAHMHARVHVLLIHAHACVYTHTCMHTYGHIQLYLLVLDTSSLSRAVAMSMPLTGCSSQQLPDLPVLCCLVLSCAVLCCLVLSCAVLCCLVLSCAVLCWMVSSQYSLVSSSFCWSSSRLFPFLRFPDKVCSFPFLHFEISHPNHI